jgi:hypothetical protein
MSRRSTLLQISNNVSDLIVIEKTPAWWSKEKFLASMLAILIESVRFNGKEAKTCSPTFALKIDQVVKTQACQ